MTSDCGSLLERTLNLYRTRSRSVTAKQIAEATELPEHWLHAFNMQNAGDYGVRRVQKLHDYLVAMHPFKGA